MATETSALSDDFSRRHDAAFASALIASGTLDAKDVDRATRIAAREQDTFYSMLSRLGLLSETDLARTYSRLMNVPLFDPVSAPESPLQLDTISSRFLREKLVLPLQRTDGEISIAMADPTDTYVYDAFRLAAGVPVRVHVGERRAIDRTIVEIYNLEDDAGEASKADGEVSLDDVDVERLKDMASEAPVVRLVNQLVSKAVDLRASDIHVEPFEKSFRVRMRLDGMLQVTDMLPEHLQAAVTSRIKIMARLDIAERRIPQDGRAKTIARGKEIDLRISTLPTLYGESIVLRVLDRGNVSLDYASLGLSPDCRTFMQRMTAEPNGILLVTGPTGSGKTTTLYAALDTVDRTTQKVLTVEDPIEYQFEGVNQVQIQPNIGLTFASVLRTFLRQDPDVILLGEIRDTETARIAAQAALTGHLVMSTLHTNEAASAVTRLVDMGVEPFLLTATLNGVVAQRLVRCLCQKCREPFSPELQVLEDLGIDAVDPTLYRAKGCQACSNLGYSGRTVVMETLELNDDLRRLILNKAETTEIREAAISNGMLPMFDDGLRKALDGVTTLEEVVRTTRVA
jgi:general secretion pathway protein E